MADVVLATGLSFEVVVGFTDAQFTAVQKAIRRHWETMASVNGIRAFFGGSRQGESEDMTEAFERKVRAVQKATGKKNLDLWRDVMS